MLTPAMLRMLSGTLALLCLLLMAACASQPPASAPAAAAVTAGSAAAMKAVLIAGDGSIAVFDDATASMARWLRAQGVPQGNIVRLSASPSVIEREGARLATLRNVVAAVAAMAPPPGGSCFIFATSHGGHGGVGLYLAASGTFLPPMALAWAVQSGCGSAPTAIVVSACYSGVYARAPVAAPSHVVLTAARADRSSFGCAAGRTYTVYDACLLRTLGVSRTWRDAAESVRACIGAEEHRLHYGPPSEPQAYIGPAVRDLAVP
jgi:hypothetical protein